MTDKQTKPEVTVKRRYSYEAIGIEWLCPKCKETTIDEVVNIKEQIRCGLCKKEFVIKEISND